MFTHAGQQDMGGDYADRTPEVDGETKNHTTLRSLLSVFCVSREKSLNKHRIFF